MMKFFFTALLASAATATAVQGRKLSADALAARRLEEENYDPTIAYDAMADGFIIGFPEASSSHTADGMAVEFYDANCKNDGTEAFTEYIIPDGITDFGNVSRPVMDMDGGAPDQPKPQLKFMINHEVIANDAHVYKRVTNRRGEEHGVMKMCVRSSFGHSGGGAFQEASFVEFLVTIKYYLEDGFAEIVAFQLRPKKIAELFATQIPSTTNTMDPSVETIATMDPSVETIATQVPSFIDTMDPSFINTQDPSTSATQYAYGLEAYVCDPAIVSTVTGPGGTTRAIPDRITTYDTDGGGTGVLTQGDTVTVCVIPNDFTHADGIRLDGIVDFDWYHESQAPVASRVAIFDGLAANALTSYAGCSNGGEWCHFSSVLFADFHHIAPEDEIYGAGTADLVFGLWRRRLGGERGGGGGERGERAGDNNSRRRMEMDAASTPFDLGLRIRGFPNGDSDAIKTAGGASLGGCFAPASAAALLAVTAFLA